MILDGEMHGFIEIWTERLQHHIRLLHRWADSWIDGYYSRLFDGQTDGWMEGDLLQQLVST